jgi:hypothetical protein
VEYPCLKRGYHPGFDVEKQTHIATLLEHGTGRTYDIPNSRFSKAAMYLRESLVWDALNQHRGSWESKNSQAVCRCLRRCVTGVDLDFILSSREWFYTWQTHDEAVGELGKVMRKNLQEKGHYYIVKGKEVQLMSLSYINHLR